MSKYVYAVEGAKAPALLREESSSYNRYQDYEDAKAELIKKITTSKEEALAMLVRAGIATTDGQLAEPYR